MQGVKGQLALIKVLSVTIFGSAGAYMNFINLHLEQEVGLTGTQIGLVNMLSLGLVVLAGPVIGALADKTGRRVLIVRFSLLASLIVGAFFAFADLFAMVLILAILFELARGTIAPLMDIVTSDFCAKNQLDFGKVRVFASIGFLSVTMIVGFLIAGLYLNLNGRQLGFAGFLNVRTALFGMTLLLLGLSFMLSFFLQEGSREKQDVIVRQKFSWKTIRDLLKNPHYRFLIVFLVLSMIALESAKMYAGNHLVVGLGANENIVSWMTFAMVGPELFLLPLGNRLIRKYGFKKWYTFTIITMIIRMLIYGFTTHIGLFLVVSLVHGLGTLMHICGNIPFLRHIIPEENFGLAFTLMASFMALSRAIFSFGYGLLYEWFDGFMVFRASAALLTLGLIWVLTSKSLKAVGDEITQDRIVEVG